MGSLWSNIFDGPVEYEVREFNMLKMSLSNLLRGLSPEDILQLAIEDTEVYELCKEVTELRQACIIAAVRRYHTEKYFYEEVHNRTADYMVMLDHFVQIQDEKEAEEFERSRGRKKFPWCFSFRRRRNNTPTNASEELLQGTSKDGGDGDNMDDNERETDEEVNFDEDESTSTSYSFSDDMDEEIEDDGDYLEMVEGKIKEKFLEAYNEE